MSAPENSNSKTPPSLLSDTKPAGEGGPQQSRILANLEGRVTPPAEAPRRSLKGPIAAVVALVVAVGGWGAWRWQQQSGEQAVVAAAPAPAQAAKAEAASGAAVQVAQNAASAAPAAQPATIVNDDAASQTVASASGASGADNSRLSRALANGADDASGAATAGAVAATAAAAAATTKSAKADAAQSGKVAARGKADAKADAKAEARKHHKEQQAELAQAKKRHDATTRTASAKAAGKDDPDADLLAALVARTKPADKKVAAQKGQAVPTKTAATTGGSLAARVKECSERGFFEDQLCRWRVCDGHWGKDPACPTAAQSETRQ
ncbi:phage tail protein [Burkholderia diffusa]|uniref:phage tail protein n=1 Tax=Burkholderia diffusa TaxID=488732 RepID=UPI002AB26137|nr:phage tail protein [Burkholderia diffusa]